MDNDEYTNALRNWIDRMDGKTRDELLQIILDWKKEHEKDTCKSFNDNNDWKYKS